MNKKKNGFSTILLSLVMLLSFASCTQNDSSQISDLEMALAQKEAEISLLNQQLTSKEAEISQLKERVEKAEGDLNEKDTAYAQIQNKVEEYEEYEASFSKAFQIERYYVFHEREEVTYTDGTIELITGWEYHFGPWLNRKYRYSYYVIELPITQALQIVRGEDFYDDHPRTIGDPSKFVYNSQECAAIDGQPIMHAYTAWILDYHVSKAEMREILEIISDINHSVYDEYNREEINFKSEKWELPNIDVLYSFDQDIINEYYRYA